MRLIGNANQDPEPAGPRSARSQAPAGAASDSAISPGAHLLSRAGTRSVADAGLALNRFDLRAVCEDRAVQTGVPDASSYIAAAPADRRETLAAIRQLCLDELSGYEETMTYGMPSYTRDGVVEVSFASQRRNIALYILKQDVLDCHRSELGGLSLGKGVIRYRNVADVDLDVVRALLAETQQSENPIC
jgi:uncharacterized protein YdhG (YjbR/CyaY superfamily)